MAAKGSGTTVAEFSERVICLTRGLDRDGEWPFFGIWVGLIVRTGDIVKRLG